MVYAGDFTKNPQEMYKINGKKMYQSNRDQVALEPFFSLSTVK